MTLTRSLPNKIALPRPQRSANVPDNVVAFNAPLQRSSWSPTTAETEDDARGCLPTSRRDGFGRALGLNGGRAHSHGRDHDRRHTLHVGQNRNGALVTPRPSTGRSRGTSGPAPAGPRSWRAMPHLRPPTVRLLGDHLQLRSSDCAASASADHCVDPAVGAHAYVSRRNHGTDIRSTSSTIDPGPWKPAPPGPTHRPGGRTTVRVKAPGSRTGAARMFSPSRN